MKITTILLQELLGNEVIKGNKKLTQRFDEVLYLYRCKFPSSKLGSKSLTIALAALEFICNADVYFKKIAFEPGKIFFDSQKAQFLKHFNYTAITNELRVGDYMLFLYNPLSGNKRRLSAHGVIGRFRSIEYLNSANEDNNCINDMKSKSITVRLMISNDGIVELPINEMEYFGRWNRKLELII